MKIKLKKYQTVIMKKKEWMCYVCMHALTNNSRCFSCWQTDRQWAAAAACESVTVWLCVNSESESVSQNSVLHEPACIQAAGWAVKPVSLCL